MALATSLRDVRSTVARTTYRSIAVPLSRAVELVRVVLGDLDVDLLRKLRMT
jgi:hypothetical protein